MSSTHGNLVLPPLRPVAEGGTEDHRSRRAIAPPIASRLSESAFASGPPKVSSPRCSPDAYDGVDAISCRKCLSTINHFQKFADCEQVPQRLVDFEHKIARSDQRWCPHSSLG